MAVSAQAGTEAPGAAAVPDRRAGRKPPSPWRILKPVQGQIRLAMAISAGSALAALGVMVSLMLVIRALLERPDTMPWGPLGAAALCTVAAYAARLGAFNQAHYAAFRLERILRIGLANRLARARWPRSSMTT